LLAGNFFWDLVLDKERPYLTSTLLVFLPVGFVLIGMSSPSLPECVAEVLLSLAFFAVYFGISLNYKIDT
jgi:hypothetical protein